MTHTVGDWSGWEMFTPGPRDNTQQQQTEGLKPHLFIRLFGTLFIVHLDFTDTHNCKVKIIQKL